MFFGPAGSLERTVRRIFPGPLEGDTCRGDIHWQGQFSGFFFFKTNSARGEWGFVLVLVIECLLAARKSIGEKE